MPALKALPVGFGGNASDLYTTPYPHSLGDRARDKDGNEYVFVDFSITGASIGSLVTIDAAYQAQPLTESSSQAGRVGVVVAASPTTNNAGWVQVYGFALVQGSAGYAAGAASASDVSVATSAGIAIVPTTVVTSPLGAIALVNLPTATSLEQSSVEINQIFGMWPVLADASNVPGFSGDLSAYGNTVSGAAVTQVSETSGAVTNTTAGISNHLLPVFLNYPYHLNQFRSVDIITS